MSRPPQTPPQPADTDADEGAAVPEKAVTSDGTGTPESAVAPASAGSPEGAVAPLRSATPDMAAGTAAADGSEHSRLIAREPSAIVLESIQAIQPLVDQLLLREYSPPAVLVNSSGDIVYINGRTGRYLEPAAGRANWNIHVMGRNGLREPLSNALLQAVSQQSPVELRGATVEDGAQTHRVDITVRPLYAIPALEGMVMILFREMSPQPKRRRGRLSGDMQFDLETQLQEAREHIQAQREEMRISQEELQATNEELQSNNEELQSTNEELTSSKEEMQSMNEELHAVNAELQSRLDELAMAQSDMRNLLNSTEIATLFLDNDLNVRRFTEQSRKLFSLRDADIGRPLSDLANVLDYSGLQDDVREMLRTLTTSQREVSANDGRWFSVRIMPYRTVDNVIQGAVITFVDISVVKQLESSLRGVDSPAVGHDPKP